jgi:hypothetical protein
MSTSEAHDPGTIYSFDLRDYTYSRVDLEGLEGQEFRDLLRASAIPGTLRGTAPEHGRWGDLVGTYSALLFLISARLERLMIEARLTGWRAVPVAVEPVGPEGLKLLQVTGRCGPITSEPSGVGRRLQRQSLSDDDLWVPANESTILVSERCARSLGAARLVNVEIEPAGIELW